MQPANKVENKQYQFRLNSFIDKNSTIHFLISHQPPESVWYTLI